MPKKLSRPDISKLGKAMEYSRFALEPYRRNRTAAIRQFVGRHYSKSGSRLDVVMNLIELSMQVYVRQLASNDPSYLVTAFYPELRPFAANFELAINKRVREMNLGMTLRRVVTDAMFSIGIVKSGIDADGTTSFVESVSLDDWVMDMNARRHEDCQFMGNRYLLPLEEARERQDFDRKIRRDMAADEDNPHNETGDERSNFIGRGKEMSGGDGAYRECVELWDLWLPHENALITFQAEAGPDKILRYVPWDGPEGGPFRMLRFNEVPDNLMPLPPVASMMDLHLLVNKVMRKLASQAERQKSILGYRAGKDAKNIVDTSDGEAVSIDDPKSAQELNFGGINETSLAFLLQIKEQYVWLQGNLDALGGLSAQADTATQESLLHQSAANRMADMQAQTVAFAQEIGKMEAWKLWTDPIREMTMYKTLPGMDDGVYVQWTPEARMGEFIDYNFDIVPYSMTPVGPAQKLQAMKNIVGELVLPLAPLMQAEGVAMDFEYFFDTIQRLGQLPELDGLFYYSTPSPSVIKGGAQGNPSPGVEVKRQTNVSVQSRATREAKVSEAALMAGTGTSGGGTGY